MISFALIQFCLIVLHNFLTYTCHFNTILTMQNIKLKLIQLCGKTHSNDNLNDIALNIPECTYNYAEYQDELVTDDFK